MSANFPWVNWAKQSFITELPLEQKVPNQPSDHPYLPIDCGTTLKRTQFSDDESELSLDLEEENPPTSKKPRHLYWTTSSQTGENDCPGEGSSLTLPSQFKSIHISTRTSNTTEYDDINQLLNAAHQIRRQTHPSEEAPPSEQFATPVYQNYQNINEVLRDLHFKRRNP